MESGLHAAWALCLLLGYPSPPPPPISFQPLPANATTDFIGGLLEDLTNTSLRDGQIYACYQAPTPDTLSIALESGFLELKKNTTESVIAAFTIFFDFTKNCTA